MSQRTSIRNETKKEPQYGKWGWVFHLGHPVQAELLEIPSQGVHQTALVAVELAQPSWILSRFRIVLDNVIYGTVEDHKPRGVAGYNLRQNPGGCRDLFIPALIGYQAVQNLLPDALLMLRGNALLPAFLNSRQAVLEGVHVAWWAAFAS
jgi:hypothetical protein